MDSVTAVLQALVFVGSVGLLLSLLGGAVLFALMGRRAWAQGSIAAAGLLVSTYAVALLVTGALSRPRVIAHGEAKAFCEIDCHVAYAVTLQPGSRAFALVGTDGRRWQPSRVHMLDSAPLFARMRPGETHRAQLSFDVPQDVPIAGLLVEDDSPISPLLIGHERSPLHRKTLLALPANATRARAEHAPSARVRRG